MILKKIDSKEYKSLFIEKFTNFAEKSPVIISFATDDIGVTVVHENSGRKYFYPWDYVTPVKMFIHEIKKDLISNHYPRISRTVEVERSLTPEEQASYIASGMSLDDVPSKVTEEVEELYRIDKIIVMKDEFVIVNEKTLQQFCYHMKGSAFSYLRNYRTGKFGDIEEAGRVFFENCTLVKELNKLAE